jgi:hypothetical protein
MDLNGRGMVTEALGRGLEKGQWFKIIPSADEFKANNGEHEEARFDRVRFIDVQTQAYPGFILNALEEQGVLAEEGTDYSGRSAPYLRCIAVTRVEGNNVLSFEDVTERHQTQ